MKAPVQGVRQILLLLRSHLPQGQAVHREESGQGEAGEDASLVGEEQEETGEALLSYAAVLKDPTLLACQRRERVEEVRSPAQKSASAAGKGVY